MNDEQTISAIQKQMEKRSKIVRFIIRNMARLSVFTVAFPILQLVYRGLVDVFTFSVEDVWLMTGFCVAVGFICCIICSFFYKKETTESKEKLIVFVRIILGAVFAAAAVFFTFLLPSNNRPIFSALTFPAAGITFSILGGTLASREVDGRDFIRVTIFYIVGFLGLLISKVEFSTETFVWLYLFVAAVYAILRNYDRIDMLMNRRGHSSAKLPPRIRRFNLILLGILFAFALVLVLLRVFFADVLSTIVTGVVYLLGTVVGFIFSKMLLPLVEFFFNTDDKTVTGKGGLETIDMNKLLGLEEPESFRDNPLYMATVYAAGITVALILLFFLWKPVTQLLRKLFLKLSAFLRKHLYNKSLLKKGAAADANEYYSDVDESLEDGEVIPDEQELLGNRELRQWKQRLRQYGHMEPGREKYLYGYRLTREGLPLHGVAIRKSDTAMEVLEKAQPILADTGFASVTACANELAFAQAPSGEPDYASIEKSMETLRDYKPPEKEKNTDRESRRLFRRRER